MAKKSVSYNLMSPDHKAVGRSVCYALGCDNYDRWEDLTKIFVARLTRVERTMVAFSALYAIPYDLRPLIYEALGDFEMPQGAPLAPFSDEVVWDAKYWAASASKEELRAYLVAIINHLDADDRKIAARNLQRSK
tara:strand:- start:3329 stop:3733 length:405 start_codon:yes stop_codon:yes gene_type:complete